MWKTAPRFDNPAFYPCPIDELSGILSIDRQRIDDAYRKAYEQARKLHSPPIHEQLAPSLN